MLNSTQEVRIHIYIYDELDNNSNDWVAQIIQIIPLAKQTRAAVLLIIKGSAYKRCCTPNPRIILLPATTMNNDQKMGNSKNSKRRTQAVAAWSRTPRRSIRIWKIIFKTKNLMGTPSRVFRAAARRGITPQNKIQSVLYTASLGHISARRHMMQLGLRPRRNQCLTRTWLSPTYELKYS